LLRGRQDTSPVRVNSKMWILDGHQNLGLEEDGWEGTRKHLQWGSTKMWVLDGQQDTSPVGSTPKRGFMMGIRSWGWRMMVERAPGHV